MPNVTGTNGFDFIDTDPMNLGLPVDDTVNSGAGGDFVITRNGNDTVNLGDGHDTAYLGDGDDLAHGDAGDDMIHAGAGEDEVHGDSGDDTLYGASGDDLLFGESGNDQLDGGSGNDVLRGESGNDSLEGGSGNDELYGGSGDDTLVYDAADTVIDGGSGTDTVYADGQNVDIGSPLVDVEVIDLTDGVANSFDYMGLDIIEEDIEAITDSNNTLRVEGDAGDQIDIDTSGWLNSGFQDVGTNAAGYNVWIGMSSSGEVVTLEIDPDVTVV